MHFLLISENEFLKRNDKFHGVHVYCVLPVHLTSSTWSLSTRHSQCEGGIGPNFRPSIHYLVAHIFSWFLQVRLKSWCTQIRTCRFLRSGVKQDRQLWQILKLLNFDRFPLPCTQWTVWLPLRKTKMKARRAGLFSILGA